MNVARKAEATAPDPMALVRAMRRMQAAGFALSVEDGKLMVEPLSKLTDLQRAYLRTHRTELVALLADAETLAAALDRAGPAGLGWREGTPPEWPVGHLLAVGEVLYGDGRMVSRLGRCYSATVAPPLPRFHDAPQTPEIEPRAAVAA